MLSAIQCWLLGLDCKHREICCWRWLCVRAGGYAIPVGTTVNNGVCALLGAADSGSPGEVHRLCCDGVVWWMQYSYTHTRTHTTQHKPVLAAVPDIM